MNTKRQRIDDQCGHHAPTHASPAAASVATRTPKLKLCAELATKLGTRYCSEGKLLMLMLANKIYSRTDEGGLELCLDSGKLATMLSAFSPNFREEEVVTLMLSEKLCSRVLTFEVRAGQMGDLNGDWVTSPHSQMGDLKGDWVTITLEDGHALTADVKKGVERVKGIRPAMQELFRYDESWTGTKASGGSGHTKAQEDAALLEESYVFEGPCSVVVSVNELYDVVLEGQEVGELRHDSMGVYERLEGKEVSGRGVWQKLGTEVFLYFSNPCWFVSMREYMDAAKALGMAANPRRDNLSADKPTCYRSVIESTAATGVMCVESTAANPEEITEVWQVSNQGTFEDVPMLQMRVCSSVKKHAAVQHMEQQQVQALEQAQQRRRLVLEGLADVNGLMGAYDLMQGKVVNRRAVWQRQSREGDIDLFLFNTGEGKWIVSMRESMLAFDFGLNPGDFLGLESGAASAVMDLRTAALTPDQQREAELWRVSSGTEFVETPEVRLRCCGVYC
jgi:hypothetical protein